jgi:arginine-tRNA-protein transferase
VCAACNACRSIRVPVASFRPDRSQRRCRQANAGRLRLEIGPPAATAAVLELYDRYHAFQTNRKDWPEQPTGQVENYADSFVRQPFSVEEWRYYLGSRLVGVGYVDALPGPEPGRLPLALQNGEPLAGGLSAIYFFYDPEQRPFSPGIWNVLSLIEEAARRGLPHVYLGYFVEGCSDMAYKARFRPNELRRDDGVWSRWLD